MVPVVGIDGTFTQIKDSPARSQISMSWGIRLPAASAKRMSAPFAAQWS